MGFSWVSEVMVLEDGEDGVRELEIEMADSALQDKYPIKIQPFL